MRRRRTSPVRVLIETDWPADAPPVVIAVRRLLKRLWRDHHARVTLVDWTDPPTAGAIDESATTKGPRERTDHS